MSYRETYGAAQNEPSRHDDTGERDVNTYGTRYNEPSRSRQDTGRNYGQHGNDETNSSGTTGNEPSQHWASSGGTNTYGATGNEPHRHRDTVDVFVRNINGGDSRTMTVDLDWSQDTLVREVASNHGMNASQVRLSALGKPLNGAAKVRAAKIIHGCTIDINGRLRGG